MVKATFRSEYSVKEYDFKKRHKIVAKVREWDEICQDSEEAKLMAREYGFQIMKIEHVIERDGKNE